MVWELSFGAPTPHFTCVCGNPGALYPQIYRGSVSESTYIAGVEVQKVVWELTFGTPTLRFTCICGNLGALYPQIYRGSVSGST